MRVTVALPTLKTDIRRSRTGRPTPAILFLAEEAFELLIEPRQSAAAIKQMLLAAGPGRVRLRIDVEMQRIAGLAPGRTRREFGAVGHKHLDQVIIGMGF